MHVRALSQPVQPVATFILAVWLGLERPQWSKPRGMAKLTGLLLCVGGAAAVIAWSGSGTSGNTSGVGDFVLGNAFILMQVRVRL